MTHDQGLERDAVFSRPLAADDVPENGLVLKIAATERERAALAAEDGLAALTRLEADLEVSREGAGGVKVVGELRADVRQTCVVSLEEFETTIVEPIEIAFAPERDRRPEPEPASRNRRARKEKGAEETSSGGFLDLDEDEPDPLVDGRIDLGAIVAEFLALALDPYPRKPGARFDAPGEATEAAPSRSPFASLGEALRKDRGR
jgi:hypothetical protein